MRTKVLLCAVALAASLASSLAQNVYSVNVVGYYNVTVPANGFYMIANQLNTGNNTIDSLLPSVTDGSQFFKYSGGYNSYSYDASIPGWTPTGATLNPGEAGMFRDANAGSGQVLTFVGEVLQGQLVNNLPVAGVAKNSVRASIVPQAGTATALGVPAEDGDQMFVFNNAYASFSYDASIPGWTPGEPTLAVGQGFFYTKVAGGTASSWVRNFTVQ